MIADKLICAGVLFSLGFSGVRADFTMVAVYILLYPYLYLTSRRQAIRHLLAASLVACCWFFIAKGQYGYNREMLLIGGYTVYPLFAWATGLFGVYLMYSCRVRIFPNRTLTGKLIFFVVLYWSLLFGSEIVVYFLICEFSGFTDPDVPMRAALPRWVFRQHNRALLR